MNCPKCQGTMEEGFQVDYGHYNARKVTEWVEGEPQPSFWSGVSLGGVARLPIQVWRCQSCGYLESYARQTTAKL
ncbi:hypothetical protein F183_A00030 [Bryobacterales bacterium F-183]|nr:hypothetical protein F183_A00030 [Bryobacterales bacterium F-183]